MPKVTKNRKYRILALDPATECGYAHSNGVSGVWDLSIRRDESGGMRLIRFEGKLNEIYASVGFDVVVYEAARHSAPKMQGALVVQSELQGVLKRWCEEGKIAYRGYSPAEIKKHALGSGKGNKAAMVAAAKKRFGKVIDDNHADALWLLSLALSEPWAISANSPKIVTS